MAVGVGEGVGLRVGIGVGVSVAVGVGVGADVGVAGEEPGVVEEAGSEVSVGERGVVMGDATVVVTGDHNVVHVQGGGEVASAGGDVLEIKRRLLVRKRGV